MPPIRAQLWPMGSPKLLMRRSWQAKVLKRRLSTITSLSSAAVQDQPPAARQSQARYPPPRKPSASSSVRNSQIIKMPAKIKVHPPPSSVVKKFPTPVQAFTASQISLHDPTGARTALISRNSPNRLRPGDIILVRLRDAPDISGHLIEIRRKGIDSSILMRNELTRVGVEMCYKIYSPLVEGVELVERMQKKPRRARLTYLRKPKHDRGSTLGVVGAYLRRKKALLEGIQGRGSGQSAGKGKGQRVKGRK